MATATVIASRQRPTSGSMWVLAFAAIVALVLVKIPDIRTAVMARIQADPAAVAGVTDPSVQRLTVNIGIALAVAVSLTFVLLHQSLGRALERSVFTQSLTIWGGRRVGLFYLVAVTATIPPGLMAWWAGSLRHRATWSSICTR